MCELELQSQGEGEARQRGHGGVGETAFDSADLGLLHSGLLRQRRLGKFLRDPCRGQLCSERFPRSSFCVQRVGCCGVRSLSVAVPRPLRSRHEACESQCHGALPLQHQYVLTHLRVNACVGTLGSDPVTNLTHDIYD